MNDGDTASWKEQLLEDALAKDIFTLGTWATFEKDLKEVFQPYNAPGDALEEMKTLQMGSNSIEEHNAHFKMIVTRSGLDGTSPAVIDYYRKILNIPLQRRILSLENPPKTLKEWYDWAAKLDNNWRRMKRILGRSRELNDRKDSNGKKKEEPKRKFNFTRRDSETIEKREEMMKKGLCFNCGKPGHLNRDFPDKRKARTSHSPPSYSPPAPTKKLAVREIYMHIRSLTAMLYEEEKEEFYQEAEKEGF